MNAESIEGIISQISRSNLATNWLLSKRALPMTIESGQLLNTNPPLSSIVQLVLKKWCFQYILMVSASNNTIHICKVLACDSKSGLRSKPFKGHQNLGLWRRTKTGLPQTEFKCLWFICQYVFICVKNHHLQSLNVMCTLMYTHVYIYIDIYYCYSTKYFRFKKFLFQGPLLLETWDLQHKKFNLQQSSHLLFS